MVERSRKTIRVMRVSWPQGDAATPRGAGRSRACKRSAMRHLFGGDAHRVSGRAEMAPRGAAAKTWLDRHSDVAHRELDAAERLQPHDLVEPAEMADAEHLAGKPVEAAAEREIVTMIGGVDDVVGVDAGRHHDRGDGVRVP